jgi:peptide/nickel transport system ATP-binding protein
MTALLTATGVSVTYRRPDRVAVTAVRDVHLTLEPGQVLGIVGESGCGKSSLGRALVGLDPISAGTVHFDGMRVGGPRATARPRHLRRLQMIFQDPYLSLNPRRRVLGQLTDAGRLSGLPRRQAREQALALLAKVGLPAPSARRLPSQFSGGQRQRIAIARALAARPTCVIADEPISALDPSTQREIAALLRRLADEDGVAVALISHDLSVLRLVCDQIAVMYLGAVVEIGSRDAIWHNPQHPYTEALLKAVPRIDGLGVLPVDLGGEVPDPARPPHGCAFHPRCQHTEAACRTDTPVLRAITDHTAAACWVAQRRAG